MAINVLPASQTQHPHQSYQYLVQLIKEQHPIVAVLTCSDSRIAPELIFDQGLGDIFDVRVAGPIIDDAVLGSLEYAVEHLHVPLIVVLGHQNCGALSVTMAHEHPHNHLNYIIHALAPATRQTCGSLERATKKISTSCYIAWNTRRRSKQKSNRESLKWLGAIIV